MKVLKTTRTGWWRAAAVVLAAALLGVQARPALAWAHQGHILITRMACLRIINDPAAPAGLKAFLKTNMPATEADCAALATQETAGAEAQDYTKGFDAACTLPDRIHGMPEGRTKLEPYGATESKMHYIDMEYFAPKPAYKDDLSDLPGPAAFPRDVKDPRYALAGYLPLRVDDVFGRFVAALGDKNTPVNESEAVHWGGYLAHYLEDSTQPQHGTMDYKSLSYLVGKTPGVSERTVKDALGNEITEYRADRSINPHGDLEYQLFENTDAPRGELRKQYWAKLQADVAALAAHPDATVVVPGGKFDGFGVVLRDVHVGYGYLPLIGRAAAATYGTDGKFKPEVFFTYSGAAEGQNVSVLDVIALQNARAVVVVEQALREAWREAKGE